MSNRRRTFLKMLAASPLLGCSGNYTTYGDTGGASGSDSSDHAGSSGTGGASGTKGSSGAGGSQVVMPGGEPAGNVSTTSVGTLRVLPNIPIVLGRDAQGLYAMSVTCPHQGCAVLAQASSLYCPCHGSRFDSNGRVINGPARSPLVHFAVSVDAAGNISVYPASQVASGARILVS
ncbi:MAG TPA: Rieske (2Fe-2S) protein [Polyangiaceae bacterium]